jgi:tetratricopeptide (TPR) repeat protein
MRIKYLFWIFVIFIFSFSLRLNSLKNTFVLDDISLIVNNRFITDWKNASLVLNPVYLFNPRPVFDGARPMVVLSLLADYGFHKYKPSGYHLTNVLLNSFNAVLLFLLVTLLLDGPAKWYVAVFSALLFCSHPVNSEAVNVISYRADLLMLFFGLSSLIAFMLAFKSRNFNNSAIAPPLARNDASQVIAQSVGSPLRPERAPRANLILRNFGVVFSVISAQGRNLKKLLEKTRFLAYARNDKETGKAGWFAGPNLSIFGFVVSVVCFVFALASKESSVALPLIAYFYVLFFETDKVLSREFLKASAAVLLFTAFYFLFFWSRRYHYGIYDVIFVNIKHGTSPLSSFSAYFNTLSASLLHHAGKVAVPVNLFCDYAIDISGRLFVLKFIASFGLLLSFAWLFVRGIPGKLSVEENRLLRFSAGFAAVSYAPASNLVPLFNTVADRYMYFPMAGICVLVSVLLFGLVKNKLGEFYNSEIASGTIVPRNDTLSVIAKSEAMKQSNSWLKDVPVAAPVLLALVLCYSFATLCRNTVYRDMRSLYENSSTEVSNNPRAHYNLGVVYMAEKNWAKAINEFETIPRLHPLYKRSDVWFFSGLCNQEAGNIKEAKRFYLKTIILKPDKKEAYENLAQIAMSEKNYKGAAWLLEKCFQITPFDPYLDNKLGTAYAKQGKLRIALECYQEAVDLKPDYTEAWLNLIDVYQELGDRKKVKETTNLMAQIYGKNNWQVYGRSVYAK